jgi:hypothetical protein
MLRQLRHDWPVRWAHHPLCARHAVETWRIGRLHVCRGCSSAALGATGGGVAVLVAGGAWCLWILLLLAPPIILLSWPPSYKNLPRAFRDLLRIGAGALAVIAVWATWHYPMQAWPTVPLLLMAWRVFARARRRVQARACDGCPELGAAGVCSGYALQAACMRVLEARIERDLAVPLEGNGALPPWLELRP